MSAGDLDGGKQLVTQRTRPCGNVRSSSRRTARRRQRVIHRRPGTAVEQCRPHGSRDPITAGRSARKRYEVSSRRPVEAEAGYRDRADFSAAIRVGVP